MSRQDDMDDLDTWRETKVTCPYCGETVEDEYEFLAGWSSLEHDTEVTCSNCEKEFELTIELAPYYSTYKTEDQPHEG